ncbi:Glycosaminoglycan xylosylkinase [Armadillidium nasatum]|uniref:Glycosaminoglycan xylosylkinase n=1 Tax=Armadillidium nasatum TaxID=96803 RepID=A0A5N5T2U6_9CRUS|nr:Glycosaminoglycan xylosylkinase [Armadillidium nasatum]
MELRQLKVSYDCEYFVSLNNKTFKYKVFRFISFIENSEAEVLCWVIGRSLHLKSLFNDPNSENGLSDIVHAMRTQKVLHADVGFKGTQLKLMLTLEGNQKAIFKPKRAIYTLVLIDTKEKLWHSIYPLLLNITSVPLVVGRKFLLRKQILSVASKQLSKTVFYQGRRTCFYGECHFCRRKTPVCDDGVFIDGALILWLPDHLPLAHIVHPWARTYQKDKLARWEISENYCLEISPSLLSEERIDLLLNLTFLIQNGDRHHFTVLENAPRHSFISLDNGKSFGNPFVDHIDVLAPLLQCCRIRQRTYDRLFLLKGGVLSRALDELLSTDPLYPILSVLHSMALDRRVTLILAAIEACRQSELTFKNFCSKLEYGFIIKKYRIKYMNI